MKHIAPLILACGLASAVPLAQACTVQGAHSGFCLDEMDKNQDGAISKKEFEAFHMARFRELDANKDGKLSEEERLAAIPPKMAPHMPFEQRFDEVDINHDGMLSRDEAEIGMPGLFQRFEVIDADQNGKLSKGEVAAHMRRVHQQMPGYRGKGGPGPR